MLNVLAFLRSKYINEAKVKLESTFRYALPTNKATHDSIILAYQWRLDFVRGAPSPRLYPTVVKSIL